MSASIVRAVLGAATLAAVSLTAGCVAAPGYVELLKEAVTESFVEGMSAPVRNRLNQLREVPYAQLYVRSLSGEEAVFILAEQDRASGYDLWIGSSGVTFVMDRLYLRHTDGLLVDVEGSELVREGALLRYLHGEDVRIDVGDSSVMWLRTSASVEWQEQIGAIQSVQDVGYQGFAYTGPALRVVENVTVTGQPGGFERRYWIETGTRSLLRMETRLVSDAEPMILEWIRTPDRADRR